MDDSGILSKLNIETIEKRAYINGIYTEGTRGNVISKTLSFDGRRFDGIAACDEIDVDKAVANSGLEPDAKEEEKIKKAKEFYASHEKEGSIASKVNLVDKYNRRNEV